MRLEMSCCLFRLVTKKKGNTSAENLYGRADFPLSSLPWLLWLLHDNLTKRYAEEKPKRFKSNNRKPFRMASMIWCKTAASSTSASTMRPQSLQSRASDAGGRAWAANCIPEVGNC